MLCTLRRSRHHGHTKRARLGSGAPAAHDDCRLPLLPSGSDGVRGPALHRTQSSTPRHARCDRDAGPREGIQPRWSGLRVQGTASSPPSTALWMVVAPHVRRSGQMSRTGLAVLATALVAVVVAIVIASLSGP